MIELGILGTLSTHTEQICKLAQGRTDIRIVGLYGDDPARTRQLSEAYGVPICTPEELLQRCNLAAILFRDGSKHRRYAEPFIRRGIPLFVDKPFACSIEDAQIMADLCREHSCPLIGGSCVKLSGEILALKEQVSREGKLLSGYCSFTVDFQSPYGGMHFYSHHLIEVMLQLFGLGVRSISATRTGDVLTAVAAYDSFNVVMNYGVRYDQYFAGYFGEDGCQMVEYHWDKAQKAQFEELLHFGKTHQAPYPLEFFVEAVKISCALEQSMEQHRPVQV